MTMLLAVWTFQIAFGYLILADAEKNGELSIDELPEIKIGLTRFICGMIMHIQCNDELVNGLKMMKYSVNHYCVKNSRVDPRRSPWELPSIFRSLEVSIQTKRALFRTACLTLYQKQPICQTPLKISPNS